MDAQMMEIQGLSVFGTYSIAFALRSIGSILAIWLALRIANNIRNAEDDNMIAKLLGTGFGVLTVMFAYYWQTAYWSLRANTANNFKEMGESMELSAGVQQFVNNFASAEPVTAPGMIVILFDLIVLAMILVTIWLASLKNSSDYIVLFDGATFRRKRPQTVLTAKASERVFLHGFRSLRIRCNRSADLKGASNGANGAAQKAKTSVTRAALS